MQCCGSADKLGLQDVITASAPTGDGGISEEGERKAAPAVSLQEGGAQGGEQLSLGSVLSFLATAVAGRLGMTASQERLLLGTSPNQRGRA